MRNPPASARTSAPVVATSGSAKAWVVAATFVAWRIIELMVNTAAEENPSDVPQGPWHAVPSIRRSIKPAQSYTLAKACQQPGCGEKPGLARLFCPCSADGQSRASDGTIGRI